MAAVPALARFGNPQVSRQDEKPAVDAARLQRSLETVFPDLLLHGTRSCLLSMTTSLTKVSGQAHDFFTRLSQMLAFDRMMRSFMRLATAVSPFPVDFGNLWGSALLPSPQPASPWSFVPQQPAPIMGFFAPFQPQPTPSYAPALPFLPAGLQPRQAAPRPAASWPDYNMMLLVPMAMIAAAPAIEAMWGLAPAV